MVLKGTLQLLNQLKDNINKKKAKENRKAKKKARAANRTESKAKTQASKEEILEEDNEPNNATNSRNPKHFVESRMQRIEWATFYVNLDFNTFDELLIDLRESYTAVRTHTPPPSILIIPLLIQLGNSCSSYVTLSKARLLFAPTS